MSKTTKLNYEHLVQENLRNVVREVLSNVAKNGLPGNHHFYISFRADYPGVKLPDFLLEQYPEEMTIVLQYQFWDLAIKDDTFNVTLSFNDIPEHLTIPFLSIVSFLDPSVKFGLEFSPIKRKKAKSSNIIELDSFRKK